MSPATTSDAGGLNPLRVAVDGSSLDRPATGIGTYTRELLAAMLARRPEHRLTLYLRPGTVMPEELAGVDRRDIPGARLTGRHLAWPHQVRRGGFGAYFSPPGLMPLGDLGVPAAITVHDLAIYRHPEWFPPRQPLSTRLVVPRSVRRARVILTVSNHTARDLDQLFGVGAERVRLVHPGVARRFRPLDRGELTEVARRLNLPEGFILFVGTIEPRKNIGTLLEAWSGMAERPPLVIAGAWGWRYEQIRRQIEDLEASGAPLRRLGEVDPGDLPALYNLATCLAHPAWYEGFGFTPLEAMASGTPVVTSNATSLPEVVGEAAVTLAPGDVKGWRAALEHVASDRAFADRLRRKGLQRASEFRWERAAEEAWQAIEQIALKAGPG